MTAMRTTYRRFGFAYAYWAWAAASAEGAVSG